MIKIEFEDPKEEKCDCCGNTTTRLTRFVYQDDDAFAVYYAMFTEGHDPKSAYALIGLGDWDEDSEPEARQAFSVRIWEKDDDWTISILDKEDCPWQHVTYLGKILDREEALAHPWIKDVFHITDHIVMEDKPIIDFFD